MDFQVKRPKFIASKKAYVFDLESTPAIDLLVEHPLSWSAPSPPPFSDSILPMILDIFTTKSAPYFPNGKLRTSDLLSHMENIWNTDELEESQRVELNTQAAEGYGIHTRWIPARITLVPGRIEIQWNLESAEVAEAQIPPGFLEALAPEAVPSGTEEGVGAEILPESAGVADLAVEEGSTELQETEPPESVRDVGAESRERERQKVRQARLRAALAELRAERLADRYYRRYGTYEIDGEDSELSEEDDPAAGAGPIRGPNSGK